MSQGMGKNVGQGNGRIKTWIQFSMLDRWFNLETFALLFVSGSYDNRLGIGQCYLILFNLIIFYIH